PGGGAGIGRHGLQDRHGAGYREALRRGRRPRGRREFARLFPPAAHARRNTEADRRRGAARARLRQGGPADDDRAILRLRHDACGADRPAPGPARQGEAGRAGGADRHRLLPRLSFRDVQLDQARCDGAAHRAPADLGADALRAGRGRDEQL
ncbi:hypothetical protein QU38_01870, partial [Staphylococcus aureus]